MNLRRLITTVVVPMFFAVAMHAQTPAAPATNNPAEVRTYTPADFAQFAPRTAMDMLDRVPGFSVKQESEERGFGEASGNVLINGQRMSGKSNDVVTELSRIPAPNVERIEIVDGATMHIPGLTGQVANVIVRSSKITGQYTYRPEFRTYYTDPLFTRFDLSLSGTTGPLQYTVGVDNRGNRSGAGGPTWIHRPDGSIRETRNEEWRGNYDHPRFSSRLVYDGPGSSVGNLNVLYSRVIFDYLETGTRLSADNGDRERRVTQDEHGHDYEVGGDYEFGLGPGRLKLIAVGRGEHTPSDTVVTTEFADASPTEADRFTQDDDTKELIGRSEYRWTNRGAEWQISGEGAFNSLDNRSRLFSLNGNGNFEEEELPGGTARVEEDRYEVIGSYGRPIRSNLTMKLSAGGEYSRLSQVGGNGTTRTFYRPKGELSAAWKPSTKTDVNFKLARRVGQLNFYDFLASVDLTDNTENNGNADLVPEQSWELDIEGVRNLGTLGSSTLRLYGRLIDDVIDYVPIGETGESPGNLDSATVYGIESRNTFNLDKMGWRGARVDVSAQLQKSRVDDPLTGESREISNSLQRAASVSLRYDIPKSAWAFGTDASYEVDALNYRLTEYGRFTEGPVWGDFYVENKDVKGLTVRAGMYNLFAADSVWDRTVYTGRRTGPVDFIEERHRQIGPIYSFSIGGKF